jgi:hypothetical protein
LFQPEDDVTRTAWIIVGLCAATLAPAQVAMPPDAPPAPVPPDLSRPDFEAMKNQPPRPPEDLPAAARAAYEAAVGNDACPDATGRLIEAYIADYPRQKALATEDGRGLSIWWRSAGFKAYRAAYDCFVINRFTQAADAFQATGRRGYRWCGQDSFDLRDALRPGDDELLEELLDSILQLIWLSDDDSGDAEPFSPRAVRGILAFDDHYAFVDLAPIFRFNALDILRVSGVIAAEESDELKRLEKSLPQDQIGMVRGLGYYYDDNKRYSGGLYPSFRYADDYCHGQPSTHGK